MLDLKALILNRGDKAKRLSENEIYRTAKEAVRAAYMEEWRVSRVKDSETRERIFMAVRLLDEIDEKIASYIGDAEYERLKNS